MPFGTIENALLLLRPGATAGNPDLTYYFASSVPSYAPGKNFAYSLTMGGPTPYTFQAGDFVGIGSFDNIAFASRLFAGMDQVSSLFFTQGSSESADIVVFGTNRNLFDVAGPIFGFGVDASQPVGIRQDIILTPTGVADYRVTFAHEAMHTVGIRDIEGILPGGAGGEDNARYTIMSYNPHPEENSRFAAEPQLYDVAALQALWGTGTAGLGDTVINNFVEPSGPDAGNDRMFAIWDSSGTDTIDASQTGAAALIDLRPGYFSSIGPQSTVDITAGATPAVINDGRMNISIAFGAYIENAIGTNDRDLIIGNLLSNKLEGGAGDDVIYGEGIDSIHDAGDAVPNYRRITTTGNHIENAPGSIKSFVDDPSRQQDHLLGGAGDDHLRGGRGNDLIEGGADDDRIFGGAGDDIIWGGDESDDDGTADGTDIVNYSASASGITISFNGFGATPSMTVTDDGGTDTLHSIERIIATGHRDRLEYNGEIPDDYTSGGSRSLTVDMGDGTDVIVSAAGANTSIRFYINGNGTGTLKGDGPGVINLENVETQIIGSDYDDEITDLAEHDGLKRIDGGEGDDEITVDGSDAIISGGSGNDILTGGDGNDILNAGGGDDILNGGGGADRLVHYGNIDGLILSELNGGPGHDYILASSDTENILINGGAGNDVIDATGHIRLAFGTGDEGHDLLLHQAFEDPGNGVPGDIYRIDLPNLAKGDVTLIWNPVTVVDEWLPNGNPQDTPGTLFMIGDLVIKNASGGTILLRNVYGSATYWGDPSEAFSPPYDEWYDEFYLELPEIVFSDGMLAPEDYHGSNAVIDIEVASVTGYATALADHNAAIAGDPLDNQGTSGADDLRGSRGDDEIDGGDGNDNFHSSGGEDVIEGGSGSDTLTLFASRWDFEASFDNGVLTIHAGAEGTLHLTSVEAVYSIKDNFTYSLPDLIGYYGTSGNDIVTGSAADNELYGLGGDDSLHGLAGSDVIDGGDGYDTAYYAGSPSEYSMFFNPYSGAVVVSDAIGDDGFDTLYGVEALHFADGNITIEVEDLPPLGTTGNDTISGSSRRDSLYGQDGNDTLFGLAGDDGLDGGQGGDILIGGEGDDGMSGGAGNDVYVYEAGDGSDLLIDTNGTDAIEFGNSIAPEDVIVTGDGSDYVLTFSNMPGSIRIWSGLLETTAIEEVRFADSTAWTDEDLYDMAFGQFARQGGETEMPMNDRFADVSLWRPWGAGAMELRADLPAPI